MDNVVDKYAFAWKIVIEQPLNIWKKIKSGRFANTIIHYLLSRPEEKCTAKVTGKRLNLSDIETLQVRCISNITGQMNFTSIFKEQYDLLK